MKYMTGNELREAYLQFFAKKKAHLRLPSASLIPANDPTLLLIGAGMAPFKPFFTGKMKPPRARITTSQRCVRTGDIENVGRTARHQTYFEMLGNFSFGDYFKKEAITWAWEFLTDVLDLPKEKLWVTVYPKDNEAVAIWREQPDFPQDHIVKLDDNFWEIGPGPCGPDSEIYIDLGEECGCGNHNCAVGCDCDRYLEIWNLVFTQFDRTEDGQYNPLEQKNIDTGCGLERLASVMQNKKTNFETDLLFPIIEYTSKVSGVVYGDNAEKDISLKVIADHARSMTIMIMDGILPSNEGRGYVLRRILRRAVRHARILDIHDKFLEGAIDIVAEIYKGATDFEDLAEKKEYIKKVISIEEDRFAATLAQGMELLNKHINDLKHKEKRVLAGEIGFKLYDTYGFPWEVTDEILHENGMELDKEIFEKEMTKQRERARAARQENQRIAVPDLSGIDTCHLFLDENATESTVVAICKNGAIVDELTDGEEASIILERTPFYAEGGGQVGDVGIFKSAFGCVKVENAKKLADGTIYHIGYVEEGILKTGDKVAIQIDMEKKLSSARNHTATHLLQAALKCVVGKQVNQAGSLVTPDRLRFDFSNFEPVTALQLQEVERLVNEQILLAKSVEVAHMSIDKAKEMGAMALFGEKYAEIVRVVSVPDFSIELCGGSHVKNVAEIGIFKIISEAGVASGVRRIEALTGKAAIDYMNEKANILTAVSHIFKCRDDEVLSHIESALAENKKLKQEIAAFTKERAMGDVDVLLANKKQLSGISFAAGIVEADNIDDLRKIADMLLERMKSGVVVLAAAHEGKVNLVAKASVDAAAKGVHAGNIVKQAAKVVGGGGGGRKEMAQAGGKEPDKIPEALQEAEKTLAKQLA